VAVRRAHVIDDRVDSLARSKARENAPASVTPWGPGSAKKQLLSWVMSSAAKVRRVNGHVVGLLRVKCVNDDIFLRGES